MATPIRASGELQRAAGEESDNSARLYTPELYGMKQGARTGLHVGRQEHCVAEECLDASEIPLIRVLAVEDSRSDLLSLEKALAEVQRAI